MSTYTIRRAVMADGVQALEANGEPSWEDAGETFTEAPAPERTLGSRLLELKHLTGIDHAAVEITD